MIKKHIRIYSTLLHHNQFRYLSPFGKPIDSLALNSIIQGHIEMLRYVHQELLVHPAISVVIGSMCIRGIYQFVGMAATHLKLKNSSNRKTSQLIKKIFLVDLQRDIKFYNISQLKAQNMRAYYKPNQIFKYFINSYLLLNFGRSLNALINDHNYLQFCLSSTNFSLLQYDPTFITPVIVMALNFILINRSTHPFFIHLRQKHHLVDNINIGFVSGLIFVTLPLVYNLSYIGFVTSHILIRMIKKQLNQKKQKKIIAMFEYKQ